MSRMIELSLVSLYLPQGARRMLVQSLAEGLKLCAQPRLWRSRSA
jgi:hypothetical protein